MSGRPDPLQEHAASMKANGVPHDQIRRALGIAERDAVLYGLTVTPCEDVWGSDPRRKRGLEPIGEVLPDVIERLAAGAKRQAG